MTDVSLGRSTQAIGDLKQLRRAVKLITCSLERQSEKRAPAIRGRTTVAATPQNPAVVW